MAARPSCLPSVASAAEPLSGYWTGNAEMSTQVRTNHAHGFPSTRRTPRPPQKLLPYGSEGGQSEGLKEGSRWSSSVRTGTTAGSSPPHLRILKGCHTPAIQLTAPQPAQHLEKTFCHLPSAICHSPQHPDRMPQNHSHSTTTFS